MYCSLQERPEEQVQVDGCVLYFHLTALIDERRVHEDRRPDQPFYLLQPQLERVSRTVNHGRPR